MKRGTALILAAAFIVALCGISVWLYNIQDPGVTGPIDAQATQEAHDFLATPNKPVSTGTYAVVEIPRLGLAYPLKEGTDAATLKSAVGHYTGTANPGEPGNVGLAGHSCCSEHASPFRSISQLVPGDVVILATYAISYTYHVVPMPACGSYTANAVVDAARTDVISPRPCETSESRRRLLTMTTCTPVQAAETPWRLVVWAELTP